jgi:hypothetical protein
MKTQIKFLIIIVLAVISTTASKAQIDFNFKVNTDTTNWKGGKSNQSIVSWTSNDFLQIQVDGGFWAVAAYEPKNGVNWNFDANKVVVVKVQKKFGDLFVKFYDKAANKNYKLKDPLPLTIKGTTCLIHVIAFENYANEFPDIQSGTKTFTNLQIAHESVSVGQQIQVDWIKSFPTIDAAYEYVGPMIDALDDIRSTNIRISTANNSIKITGMKYESKVEVIDSKGTLIFNKKMINGDISGLNKGVYIIKIENKASKIII